MIETVFGQQAYKNSKITVIGAGPAGLLAAYRLKQASLNVQVFEARSRIGGRLFSAPAIQAEFGAWSLSNAGKPELFKALSQELGLELDEGVAPFKRLALEKNQLVDTSSRTITSKTNDPEKTRALFDTIIRLSHTAQDALDTFYQDEPDLKMFAERLLWGYFGSPAKELSALIYKEAIIQLCLGGVSDVYKQGSSFHPVVRLRGGNDLFVKKFAQYLSGDIQLNKALISVQRVTDSDKLKLTFADGTSSETDLLVLALPVSAYRELTFEDGLIPAQQLASMERVRPGTITKVLVPALGNMRPSGFITTEDFGAAMSENERFLTLYWRTPFTLERCKQQVALLAEALGWSQPTEFIRVADDRLQTYPQDAVFIIDWVHTTYTQGSFCAYSPSNEALIGCQNIEGVVVNSLFKPAGSLYFVGEAASVTTAPGTIGAAFESAELVASLIKQRLHCLGN